MTPRGLVRWLAADRSGSTVIEFGLIAVPLLTLIFGGIEVGRVMWTQNALMYSVDEAARCASVNTILCASATQVETFAAARAGAVYSADTKFKATLGAACGNDVSVTSPFTINIPLKSLTITLTADACYPKS